MTCHCSDYQSSGLPCVGACPNAPKIERDRTTFERAKSIQRQSVELSHHVERGDADEAMRVVRDIILGGLQIIDDYAAHSPCESCGGDLRDIVACIRTGCARCATIISSECVQMLVKPGTGS